MATSSDDSEDKDEYEEEEGMSYTRKRVSSYENTC